MASRLQNGLKHPLEPGQVWSFSANNKHDDLIFVVLTVKDAVRCVSLALEVPLWLSKRYVPGQVFEFSFDDAAFLDQWGGVGYDSYGNEYERIL